MLAHRKEAAQPPARLPSKQKGQEHSSPRSPLRRVPGLHWRITNRSFYSALGTHRTYESGSWPCGTRTATTKGRWFGKDLPPAGFGPVAHAPATDPSDTTLSRHGPVAWGRKQTAISSLFLRTNYLPAYGHRHFNDAAPHMLFCSWDALSLSWPSRHTSKELPNFLESIGANRQILTSVPQGCHLPLRRR